MWEGCVQTFNATAEVRLAALLGGVALRGPLAGDRRRTRNVTKLGAARAHASGCREDGFPENETRQRDGKRCFVGCFNGALAVCHFAQHALCCRNAPRWWVIDMPPHVQGLLRTYGWRSQLCTCGEPCAVATRHPHRRV